MSSKRDTYRYRLLDGRKTVYVGITKSPERRGQEHQVEKSFDRMRVEGPRVSGPTALEWEQAALEAYRRSHGGKLPKYND